MSIGQIKYFDKSFSIDLKGNKKLVFTNGCFDLLHLGHLKLLEASKEFGDYLIVGLNSNESVKSIKGLERPINDQYFRAYILAMLEIVDMVVIFNEETPLKLIKEIRPNVIVKGGDYIKEEVVGYDYVKSYGGEIIIIPVLEGFSSTSIIKKIKR
jgi:rfaE bifunctional protein nucleotidyltransferase chain/domain